jgi:L-aspartate oxidase
VFGRRAALAALHDPRPPASAAPDQAIHATPPSDETRAALWRHAGLRRSATGLRTLLDDPFPLARLIAASALAREESRGAHQRVDHPLSDPALDRRHTLVAGDEPPRFEQWT